MQFIPLSRIPSQRFNVVLADQNCTITLYWRQTRLFMDLFVGSAPVCYGAICQNGANIVSPKSRAFLGSLHFFDTEGDEPPQYDDLYDGRDGRWLFVYVPDGEELPEALEY